MARTFSPQLFSSLATGCAIFSMFFGAGNIIFPIELGKKAGHNVFFGLIGLTTTGVIFTFIGLISLILYEGDHHAFFGTLGKRTGFIVSSVILIMIGPLTGIPRSLTVLYDLIEPINEQMSLPWFITIYLVVLFGICSARERVMPLLGYIISPLLLISLTLFIFRLCFRFPLMPVTGTLPLTALSRGIREGYATMDLLAAFHFAPLAITYLKRIYRSQKMGIMCVTRASYYATGIAGLLLFVVYAGLSYIGAGYGHTIATGNPAVLARTIVLHNSAPTSALILQILILLAISSTAISLTTIFSDYIYNDISKQKISYQLALLITLGMTGLMTQGGLHTLLVFEKPFLYICYPPLIILAILNIYHKTIAPLEVRTPVLCAFITGLIAYTIH